MHRLLLLTAAFLLLGCPIRRDPVPNDDDAADDDDAVNDDDAADDDDSAPDDDDDSASSDDDDDDDDAADDDDATPDPAFCILEAVSFIESSGILPPTTAVGDLPAQTIYSCETYQMLGVNLLAASAEATAEGAIPTWTLTGTPFFSINDAATPATLSLTGCAPYECGYHTNSFAVTASADMTILEGTGPGDVPMLDVMFSAVTHDVTASIQINSILTGCSLGNLNEDLQANGVDIFQVVVNDLAPHVGVSIQLHLYNVEVAAEAASIECLAGR